MGNKLYLNITIARWLIISISVLLAVLGAFAYYGSGLPFEGVLYGDEDFVIMNAINFANNLLNYSLSNWYGYKHYSPFFVLFMGFVIFLADIIGSIFSVDILSYFENVLVVGRFVNITLFTISLFALYRIFLIQTENRELSTLGLLIYVAIFGTLHTASMVRAEQAVLATTIIFIWAIFKAGPRPGWKALGSISVLAAVPIGIEIYGAIVVGASMFFYILNERYLDWKEKGYNRNFFFKTSAVVILSAALFFSVFAVLNFRILTNYSDYVWYVSHYQKQAILRFWEMSVLGGIGSSRSMLEILLYLFEWLSPLIAIAVLYQLYHLVFSRRYKWWFLALLVSLVFWSRKYSESTGGLYLVLPMMPLFVLTTLDFLKDQKRVMVYLTVILCTIGIFRVAANQLLKFGDTNYRDAYEYLIKTEAGNNDIHIYEYGFWPHRAVKHKPADEKFYNDYSQYLITIPKFSDPPNVLTMPASWTVRDISDAYYGRSLEIGLANIQKVLDSDLSIYEYVVFDGHWHWFDNYWIRNRNPELSTKWYELYEKLKEGREKVYETGGINSRMYFNQSIHEPIWTVNLVLEFMESFPERNSRETIFGPKVTIYKRKN
ncbi:MAG: elongin A domain-containing protein [Nitrospinota bacterium]|nr:elongin A domain-containing protein [Nitrospinota bacterium]